MRLFKLLFIWFIFTTTTSCFAAPIDEMPVSYQGRFRPASAYAQIWLSHYYHAEQLKTTDLSLFHTQDNSALTLLWRLHFLGVTSYQQAPLFWIHHASLKELLQLDKKGARFSFDQLKHTLDEPNIALPFTSCLIRTAYLSAAKKRAKVELTSLTRGLWVITKAQQLVIAAQPDHAPWNALSIGTVIALDEPALETPIFEEALALLDKLNAFALWASGKNKEEEYIKTYHLLKDRGYTPEEISNTLEEASPLSLRLQNAGRLFAALPSKLERGHWLSLAALKVKVYNRDKDELEFCPNFTCYRDSHFHAIRSYYLDLERAFLFEPHLISKQLQLLSEALIEAYRDLQNTPYAFAAGKSLVYPSLLQLTLESYYYRYPLIWIAIIFYAIGMVCIFLEALLPGYRLRNTAFAILMDAFLCHTLVLALRCYILGRPPVSNMFETILYVPWITVCTGFAVHFWSRIRFLLYAASIASIILLILLQTTQSGHYMENVQAVLDSQYWLIIHVLMVVGSYGIFILSGLLAHYYLFKYCWKKQAVLPMQKAILHTLYAGTFLLIAGTILGGVWAAESWGRFWDWDPKESWAFISSCVYLVVLHLFLFRKIGPLGLAIGAIVGMNFITFTWYGVNYILGTGLHSYGFGSGNTVYYYIFLLVESLFLAGCCLKASPKTLNT